MGELLGAGELDSAREQICLHGNLDWEQHFLSSITLTLSKSAGSLILLLILSLTKSCDFAGLPYKIMPARHIYAAVFLQPEKPPSFNSVIFSLPFCKK